MEDLDFADDVAQLSSTMNHLQTKTTKLEDNSARVELKLYAKKCKTLKANNNSEASLTVTVRTKLKRSISSHTWAPT